MAEEMFVAIPFIMPAPINFYDTDDGKNFLKRALVTFCREALIQRHIATSSGPGRTEPVLAILKANVVLFNRWLRSSDKPSAEQVFQIIQQATYGHGEFTAYPRGDKLFSWAYTDDTQNDWLFWIRDHIIEPNNFQARFAQFFQVYIRNQQVPVQQAVRQVIITDIEQEQPADLLGIGQ